MFMASPPFTILSPICNGTVTSLLETMTAKLSDLLKGKKAAIVGVGNRLRGDDGVGSVIAEQLQPLEGEHVLIIDAETVPENFLGNLLEAKPEVVLFIDAVDFKGEVGEWVLVPLSALADKIPSTHTASLKLLGQILENNGVESWLLAIQPRQIGFGIPMSEEVASTAHQLVQMLTKLINRRNFQPAEMSGEVLWG
ncbi:MAG: hydrogenase 3 maturation endopeptidase HyCI [Armatimonadota bacterium]|nr:hydrogenase 3 maturation endopeptidase HyCI [Armatimonadota bacterium]MDW8143098.1 hydrogenase 3 maturation endopeptidase HyCI [Armatimonadota bacterium]